MFWRAFLLIWMMVVPAFSATSAALQAQELPDEAEPQITDEQTTDDAPNPVALEIWNARLQLLAGNYTAGQTEAMNDFRRLQFAEDVAEKFDSSWVKFHAKVQDVRWKDGVAVILTESEFPESRTVGRVKVTSGANVAQLRRNTPLEVLMDQQSAAAILPDSLIEFRGRLEFHPMLQRASRPSNAQVMYVVQHAELRGRPVGVFVSTNYRCNVNGESFVGRWRGEEQEEP